MTFSIIFRPFFFLTDEEDWKPSKAKKATAAATKKATVPRTTTAAPTADLTPSISLSGPASAIIASKPVSSKSSVTSISFPSSTKSMVEADKTKEKVTKSIAKAVSTANAPAVAAGLKRDMELSPVRANKVARKTQKPKRMVLSSDEDQNDEEDADFMLDDVSEDDWAPTPAKPLKKRPVPKSNPVAAASAPAPSQKKAILVSDDDDDHEKDTHVSVAPKAAAMSVPLKAKTTSSAAVSTKVQTKNKATAKDKTAGKTAISKPKAPKVIAIELQDMSWTANYRKLA